MALALSDGWNDELSIIGKGRGGEGRVGAVLFQHERVIITRNQMEAHRN